MLQTIIKDKISSKKMLVLGAATVALLGLSWPVHAQYTHQNFTAPLNQGELNIPAGLQEGESVKSAEKIRLLNPQAMKKFYEARGNKSLWTGLGQGQRARDVLDILKNSWADGLNPDHYHVRQIEAMLDAPFGMKDNDRLELALTDAVVRYARDMSGMRVDAAAVGQKSKYWRKPLEASYILSVVGDSPDPARTLEKLAPADPLYARLKEELIKLDRSGDKYAGILPIRFGRTILAPGMTDPQIAKLRVRLDVDYDDAYGPENLYDDNLAAAVMKFQREYGLKADGKIGPQTLAILNRTNRDRMEQLIVNMERLRWLDQDRGERYVLVNIPSQMLWAIEGDKVALEMPVIVGQPKRQTKAFKTEITGIRLNPTWTVPQGIKSQDFLPKLQENPEYLAQTGIALYEGHGADRMSVNPADVDWTEMTAKDMARFSMVQRSGDTNSLGRYRVLMNNDYDIYLHDTNHPELFANQMRALSSGCVRMSDPEAMARFILKEKEGWDEDDTKSVIAGGKMRDIAIPSPIPVYIVYLSAWLDDNGRVVFGQDVYDQDKRILSALRGMGGYVLPVYETTKLASKDQKSTDDRAAR